jgi:ribosomal protein L19E
VERRGTQPKPSKRTIQGECCTPKPARGLSKERATTLNQQEDCPRREPHHKTSKRTSPRREPYHKLIQKIRSKRAALQTSRRKQIKEAAPFTKLNKKEPQQISDQEKDWRKNNE